MNVRFYPSGSGTPDFTVNSSLGVVIPRDGLTKSKILGMPEISFSSDQDFGSMKEMVVAAISVVEAVLGSNPIGRVNFQWVGPWQAVQQLGSPTYGVLYIYDLPEDGSVRWGDDAPANLIKKYLRNEWEPENKMAVRFGDTAQPHSEEKHEETLGVNEIRVSGILNVVIGKVGYVIKIG